MLKTLDTQWRETLNTKRTQRPKAKALHDPLFSVEECASIAAKVVALKDHWVPIEADKLMALGTAAYFHGRGSYDHYRDRMQVSNPILESQFSAMFDELRSRMEKVLDKPVRFKEGAALPGFHVFVDQDEDDCGFHFDRQYLYLPWTGDWNNFKEPLTFTIPIQLPDQENSGLYLWDLHYQDFSHLFPEPAAAEFANLVARQPLAIVPYQTGVMVRHSGHYLHAVKGVKFPADAAYRITLQGHGIESKDHWEIYW